MEVVLELGIILFFPAVEINNGMEERKGKTGRDEGKNVTEKVAVKEI